jgi:hypothetical protein
MPSKCPQKQVLCQNGYLVPEAFKKEHKEKMWGICDEICHFMTCAVGEFEGLWLEEYFELGDDDGIIFKECMNDEMWREATPYL